MRRTEDSIFDNYEKKAGDGRKHNIAAAVCGAMLLLSLIVFVYIGNLKSERDAVMPEFTAALEDGDYEKALSLYRNVHDEIVAADPGQEAEYAEQAAIMDEMETMVANRLVTIEDRVRTSRYEPSSEDLRFMNGLGELTSSQISKWLYSLSEEFLLGTIEKPDIIFIFEQMSTVGNVSASATPLLKEIETIEVARGEVQSAENAFSQGDYVTAVQIYTGVIANYSGFVYDFSVERVSEIKEIMYEPMIAEGEHMLETLHYYSAEQLLSDLAVIFPDDDRINADLLEATSNTSPTQKYYGSVEVICIRQLIADPQTADDGAYIGSGRDLYLTGSQFLKMLEELYANNYVLVDAEALVSMTDPTFLVEQDLIVPEGKKPLILVIENLDYSARTYGLGTCRRLVLNDQGEVCGEYVNSEGQTITSREAEAIGILDAFVEEHHDFSYNGSKGVISLCGYESCFGYIVSEDQVDDRTAALSSMGLPSGEFNDSEIEAAQNTVMEIASVLTDHGWKFASSTYGNINANDSDMETIVSDTTKWIEQIEPLLGDVHMIVYPGGNFINGTDPRAEYLKNNGFRIFFGIGSLPYYTYGSNYLYYDRAIVNLQTLQSYDYSRLFNSNAVLSAGRSQTQEDNVDPDSEDADSDIEN